MVRGNNGRLLMIVAALILLSFTAWPVFYSVQAEGVAQDQPRSYTKGILVGSQTIKVQVVEIPPTAGFRPIIALGKDRIGGVEEMLSIAKRKNALYGINGAFFQAYAEPQEPWGTLIHEGRVLHVGNTGTTIGFTADGRVKMDTVRITIEGGTNGSYQYPDNWYAYGFNRTPSANGNAIYIYTRERGAKLGFTTGISVTVEDGVVTKIDANKDVSIPANGFVINLTGKEQYLRDRFQIGKSVSYRIVYKNIKKELIDWSDVVTAVGAGPRLLTNGRITVNPQGEGFTQEKIVSLAFNRSAIGVKADGTILLVTTPSIKIEQLAKVMQALGAKDAMNLDGGASSGLLSKGQYLTKPGRLLNNALLFARP